MRGEGQGDGAGEGDRRDGTSDTDSPDDLSTFPELGLIPELCLTCQNLGFAKPTPIQAAALPPSFQGRDIIGLAQTGSGKTAAFALPLLQALYGDLGDKAFKLAIYGLVLAPTRELAFQISDTFTALGQGIGGIRVATLVGGIDIMSQALALAKKPHVIVATPGRLLDHLENTKGFSLRGLKYLILDEADRLLDMDFGPILDKILKILPKERRTMLYSATMTSKVAKLQRASLTNPVKVEVSARFSTVESLLQYYLFFPFKQKDSYLVYLCNDFAGHLVIIFTRTCADAQRLTLLLRNLDFPAVALHGQLSQSARLSALTKFKASSTSRERAGILVATDVASRGLDIPAVDLVLNYDVPLHSKDYIHRVGRTARAGRSGQSVVFVTQYDIEVLLRIEAVLGKKLTECPVDKSAVALLTERVDQAARLAINELRERAAREKEREGRGGRGGGGGGAKRVKRSRDVGEEDLHG